MKSKAVEISRTEFEQNLWMRLGDKWETATALLYSNIGRKWEIILSFGDLPYQIKKKYMKIFLWGIWKYIFIALLELEKGKIVSDFN
jgi:hypothetical protein